MSEQATDSCHERDRPANKKSGKINKSKRERDGIKMADCVIVAPDVNNGVFALG